MSEDGRGWSSDVDGASFAYRLWRGTDCMEEQQQPTRLEISLPRADSSAVLLLLASRRLSPSESSAMLLPLLSFAITFFCHYCLLLCSLDRPS